MGRWGHSEDKRQRVALIVLLALFLNLASPVLAFARIAEAGFLNGAICHSGVAGQEKPTKPAEGKACPVCALLAAQALALPFMHSAPALPAPRLVTLPPARAPPILAPRSAHRHPYPARGPPIPV